MEIDPTIVRIIFILLTLFSGVITGIIVYIVGAIIMPEAQGQNPKKYMGKAKVAK